MTAVTPAWPNYRDPDWDVTLKTYIDSKNAILATDQGVTADATDNTAALQTILTGLRPGQQLKIPAGDYTFAGTLQVPTSDVTITLGDGANLVHTGIGQDAIVITGDRVTVTGPGTITSPANFDATTGGSDHYAVIHVRGNSCKVTGLNLVNVQNVGVYFDDVDRIHAVQNTIIGNFPMTSYVGTNTAHFGIAYNAGTTPAVSAGIIANNIVDSCVQGVFIGNYGLRGPQAGLTVTGNTFSQCHNHGIYHDDSGNPCAVGSNTFTECQIPIVVLGPGHTVTGNVIWTTGAGTADERVGINMRNSVGCVVVGNTIKGSSAGSVVIYFTQTNNGTTITGNVCANNTVDISETGTLIQLGSTGTTTLTDNIVIGNVLKGQGSATTGLIVLTCTAGAACWGNKVNDNALVIRGASHGIWASNIKHATVQNNTVRVEYNAASTTQITCVLLASCTGCKVSGNDYLNTPGYGANINMRGTSESGTCSGNQAVQNSHDPASGLLSYNAFIPIAGSEAYMDEYGTGAPVRSCAAGSRWSRTDGAANSSLYVKESDSTSGSNWTPK